MPAHPYLRDVAAGLTVGTALDAGCGVGSEALWLAERGWQVTGADISATALGIAAERARVLELAGEVTWVETDLGTWEPEHQWDFVMTNYAHPDSGQLEFYARLGQWVAPGGTLLIVGHLHDAAHGHTDEHTDAHGAPPAAAQVTGTAITAQFDLAEWQLVSSTEHHRTVGTGPHAKQLHDAVVHLRRR